MLKLIALIVPLGLDTFAASAALGAAGAAGRERLRIGLLFGSFEAAMSLIGYAVGTPVGRAVGSVGNYVAAGLVAALGVWMLFAGDDDDETAGLLRVRGLAAIGLGLSISLDELAIGLSLGVLGLPAVPVAVAVGVQALAFSQVGLALGGRLSERARQGSERAAGVALILLGGALALGQLLR
jgi:putative Mn2+ efflux pump MntP